MLVYNRARSGVYVPFVSVEYPHAKNSNSPRYNGNDNHANQDGHTTATHSRQNLSTDYTVNCRVSNHEDDIEECRDFGRPVAEEVTQDNL
jgi:hypothetical protein